MFAESLSLFFIFGGLIFSISGRHLLNCLIMLEYLVMLIFLFMIFEMSSMLFSYSYIFLFFVLTVSSASLGLSLLICLCRTHSKDYLSAYNSLC